MNKPQLFPVFLIALFVIVLIANFVNRDPETYQIIRFVSFIASIGLGIVTTLYAATAYGFTSNHGKALCVLALGMTMILAGDLVFAYYSVSFESPPQPSIVDLLFAIGYIFFFVGLLAEIRLYKVKFSSFDPFSKILMVLFFLTLGSIVLYLEVISTFDESISLIANLSRASYGIFDFFMLSLVLLILKMSLSFGSGKLFIPWLAILLGIVCSMIGDIIYSLYFEEYVNSIWPTTMLNVFWVTAYLLVSFGFASIGNIIREAQAKFTIK